MLSQFCSGFFSPGGIGGLGVPGIIKKRWSEIGTCPAVPSFPAVGVPLLFLIVPVSIKNFGGKNVKKC